MRKKTIPQIGVPIMKSNGSMEFAWYLFLQYLSEIDIDKIKDYIKDTENIQDGSIWCKEYESGMVEQGGCVENATGTQSIDVEFPITMKNLMYQREISLISLNNSGSVSPVKCSFFTDKIIFEFHLTNVPTAIIWSVKGYKQ